jgi:NAD(P)-dependent dehydrogenase (short-subunit alcohol dehydrogenase family)
MGIVPKFRSKKMSGMNGKVVLVTGGNSGIGLAAARKFAAEGAEVIITGRNAETLASAKASLKGKVHAIKSDVTKLDDIKSLFAEIKAKHGHLDVVFANAGVAEVSPTEAVTEAFFDKHFDINVKGLYFTVQAALPLLRDGGTVVLNASIAATKGFGVFSVYSATKAAVRSFARSWAVELAPRNIRVNVVSPGPITTPIYGRMGLTQEQADGFGASIVTQVPMARFGTADEVAEAVYFLATANASYINGVDLAVDGGMAQV